jgi:arginine-tRNA-protein transferase
MPGVLTLDEVNALNLGNWNLLYHGTFVHLSVSWNLPWLNTIAYSTEQRTDDDLQDLVGWEKMAYNDPQSVKGIVGELAAALGPKIVKDSAVVLFD